MYNVSIDMTGGPDADDADDHSDALQLSAHSSGDDEETDDHGHCAKHYGAGAKNHPPTAGPSTKPSFRVTVEDLVETARLLLSAFDAASSPPPQGAESSPAREVRGMARLRKRFARELELAQEAVAAATAAPSSPPPLSQPSTPASTVRRQPYTHCNGLALLEVTLACIANEADVEAVCHSEPVSSALPAHRSARRAVDVDVIAHNGGRWIKVKGMAAHNMAMEVDGASDRRPFAETAGGFADAARFHPLPFGAAPEAVLVLFELPTLETERAALVASLHSAGVQHVEAYLEPAVVAEVAAQADMYAVPDEERLAWAASMHPDAVTERLAVQRRQWPMRALPHRPRPETQPRLINLDVTALVALCSDACYGMPVSALPPQGFPVLRRQLLDEASNPTLRRHVFPCLRRYTVDGADFSEGRSPTDIGIAAGTAAFSHADLLAHVRAVARAGCADAAAGLWTAEQHAAEEAIDGQRRRLNWVVSDVAMREFRWIVRTIAGADEAARAEHLERLVHVVPTSALVVVPDDPLFDVDEETASQRKERRRCEDRGGAGRAQQTAAAAANPDGGEGDGADSSLFSAFATSLSGLRCTGKIKMRHKAVFGLGDALRCMTVTANGQFVQAAAEQHVRLCVTLHASRALVGKKATQTTAL